MSTEMSLGMYLVGLLACGFQLYSVYSSAPKQIMLLFSRKEAESHNTSFHFCPTMSSIFWFIYGTFGLHEPLMSIATGGAAVMGVILTCQVFYYRRRAGADGWRYALKNVSVTLVCLLR